MLDALTTAEVQALRLSLHDFASRQSDQVVQICCCAVDLDLARILGRQDDQMVRELAASVERLAKAVQTARTADQDDPTTLYIYPEATDIDAVTQAVKAGRSLSRVGLYWNASCLKEIGSPKFWSREALEPVLAQYNKDHPAPPQRPPPICKEQ